MPNDKTILITGATGKQGGAVARELLARGNFKIRAMTRNPQSDAAGVLARHGAEIVVGDLDDEPSLARAAEGVWGVWAVQNTWEAGVEREEAQGKRLAKVARDRNVQHYVYTSVASAQRKTGIPHFENKWRIEETVRALNFPSHVILRPVFFMENLTSPGFLHGDKLVSSLDPATVLQMIAVDDVGKFGALAFEQAEAFRGKEIDLAGDAATMPQTAAALSHASGKNIEYVRIPLAEVRKHSEDAAMMLDWFDKVGYDADIAGLQSKYGVALTKLPEWAAKYAR